MKSRCKPKRIKGRFMLNGQSAKRGLNRSISDAAWGELFSRIVWLAAKVGKPVLLVNPKHTSLVRRDAASDGKRYQVKNFISKALPEK